MVRNLLNTFYFILLFPLLAWAAPSSFVYQGQIIKPNGQPLEGSSVSFTIEILSPGAEACLLYEETHTINMSNSNGIFSLEVGSGTQSGSDYEDTSSLADAFNNTSGIITPTYCDSVGSYTPVLTDSRKLRITFDDGTGPVTISQNQNLVSVPFATSASTIDGLNPADLLQVNTGGSNELNQSNLEAVFTTTNRAELMALLGGSSTQYLHAGAASDLDANSNKIVNVSDPTNANDAANKNYVDANIGGRNVDGATIGAIGAGESGQVLTWDGSQWTSSAPSGDSTKLPLDGSSNMTGNLNLGTNNITNATDITLLNDLTVGNDVTITGGIGVGTGINSAGTITAEDQNIIRWGDANSTTDGGYVALRAPTNVASDITWTLPNVDGGAGQILSTDGSGNLSWVNDSSPVTSVFSRTGIITAQTSDYDAVQIDNTAAGNIVATNVQAAIDELDTEKVAKSGDTMTGDLVLSNESDVRFGDSVGGEYAAIQAPNDLAANYTLTLPVDDGTAGQRLQTDGSGVLSWVTDAGGSGDFMSDGSVAMTGQFDALAGTALAPGISFSTDQDTGLFNPAADTLAFSTNSTERMRLDSAGNVGIGTTTLSSLLTVASTAPDFALVDTDNSNYSLRLSLAGNVGTISAVNGTNTFLNLDPIGGGGSSATVGLFRTTNSAGTKAFNIYRGNNTATVDHVLRTDGGNSSLAINGGNVGIGTSSPARKLDSWGTLRVSNSGAPSLELFNAVSGGGEGSIEFLKSNGDPAGTISLSSQDLRYINGFAGGDHRFFVTSSEYMRLTSSGLLGIGTTSPLAKLDVEGRIISGDKGAAAGDGGSIVFEELSTSTDDVVDGIPEHVGFRAPDSVSADIIWELPGADGSAGQLLQTNGSGVLSWVSPGGSGDFESDGSVAMTGAFRAADGALATPSITFASDTDLGFYKSTTNEISFVNGSSTILSMGNNGLYLPGAVGPMIRGDGYIFAADTNSGLVHTGTADTIALKTGGSNQLTVNATGNVGIGSSAPAGKLDVDGDIRMLGSTSGYAGFQAPATAPDVIWTLPTADGSAGQILQTNGSGVLSWVNDNSADDLGNHTATTDLNLNNNNITNLAGGSAAAPSLSFNGDTNTGIFSSAGDSLSLSTAGSEAVTIDSSGHVGFGTATPGAPLEIEDIGIRDGTSWFWPQLILSDTRNHSSSPNSGIAFRVQTASPSETTVAGVSGHKENNTFGNNAGHMRLWTRPNGGEILERVRITPDGKVGIGSTAPGGKLDVDGDIRMIGSTSGYAGFQAPATAPDVIWTLPTADGSAGQILQTNGSGVLSWVNDDSTDNLGNHTATSNLIMGTNWISNDGAASAGLSFDGANQGIFSNSILSDYMRSPGASSQSRAGFSQTHEFQIRLANRTLFTANKSINHRITMLAEADAEDLFVGASAAPELHVDLANRRVGINSLDPTVTLDVNGTDALIIPRGTNLQRPGTPANGMLRYNSDTNKVEAYENSTWTNLTDGIDNLGNHTATTTLNLNNNIVTNLATGSAGAPSLSFNGDPNTGMYRAAADTLEFSTAGTARMTIDSTGEVGIGTANPTYGLHFVGDVSMLENYGSRTSLAGRRANGTSAAPTAVTNGNGLLSLSGRGYDGSSFSGNQASIEFEASENWNGTSKGTNITFSTTANGTNSMTQRMLIDNAGNVGIGITTPAARLHVNGSGAGNGLCVTSDAVCSAVPAGGAISAETTLNTGADYAEYFFAEESMVSGDLVGLNETTGKARKYISGDILLGIVSTDPGVVGNSELSNKEDTVLVALVGQVPFSKEQVAIKGGRVFTKDQIPVGYLLATGDIYINLSSSDHEQNRTIAQLKKNQEEQIKELKKESERRIERLEELNKQLIKRMEAIESQIEMNK